MTVVGDAGLGKSRLVEEAIAKAGPDVRVLRGRCLPYGQGITFWPLVEISVVSSASPTTTHPRKRSDDSARC